MNNDVQSAIASVVRTAINNNVSLDVLVRTISVEYSNAQRMPHKAVGRGSLVNYWHDKFGVVTAHVIETLSEGRLRLRLHRGAATPDVDVPNAPFSATPKKDHWSFR